MGEGWRMTNIEYFVVFVKWNLKERIVLYVVLGISVVAFVFKKCCNGVFTKFFCQNEIGQQVHKKVENKYPCRPD